jgi:hypothetical protein
LVSTPDVYIFFAFWLPKKCFNSSNMLIFKNYLRGTYKWIL